MPRRRNEVIWKFYPRREPFELLSGTKLPENTFDIEEKQIFDSNAYNFEQT